jgi:hypothetical protein
VARRFSFVPAGYQPPESDEMRARKGELVSNDVWTYRDTLVVDSGVDVTGYEVEASDGSIGKIDEATFDTGSSYIVVDTGPWIFGKKVMLPAGVVRDVDQESETVFVDRTKDQIKHAPEYDSTRVDDRYRGELGSYNEAGDPRNRPSDESLMYGDAGGGPGARRPPVAVEVGADPIREYTTPQTAKETSTCCSGCSSCCS